MSLFILQYEIRWRLLEGSFFNVVFFKPWQFLEAPSFEKACLSIVWYMMTLIPSIIAVILYLDALKKYHLIIGINIPLQKIGPPPRYLTHQTFSLPFQNPQILKPKSPNVQNQMEPIGDLTMGHHHKSF